MGHEYTHQTRLGMFRERYPSLQGRDWIRRLLPEDLQYFVRAGMERFEYGRMGGLARAQGAVRDRRGRFARKESRQ